MHLRHESQPRLLWVDAICINQTDKDEQSRQVQCMGDIYAGAKKVLVWIGEDHGDADECFALIKDTDVFLMDLLLRYEKVGLIPPIPYGNGSICADSQKWDMVRRMASSEWFSRVWVLQEIGLARSAMIIYGNSTMEWSYLVELMLFVASRPDVHVHTGDLKSGVIWDVFESIWCSFGNTESWRNELPLTRSLNNVIDTLSFTDILNISRAYQVTDQRDRVYAFLSLSMIAWKSGKNEQVLIADYNKSVDEVYLDTASCILANDPYPWTVLSCVDHATNSPSLSGQRLSWVPRWDEGWSVYYLGYPAMWYRAGGSPSAPFQAIVSKSDYYLEVQGILLDTIVWASRSFKSEDLDLEHQKREAPMQALWWELEQHDSNSVYVSRSLDREYAFSLAIVAGRAADEGRADDNPSLHQSLYETYKGMIGWSIGRESTSIANTAETQRVCLEKSTEVEALTYIRNQSRALHNRRFFMTSKGYYGVGHSSLELSYEGFRAR